MTSIFDGPVPLIAGLFLGGMVVVLNLDGNDPVALAVLGFVTGLYLVYRGFGRWKTKRLVEDTPTESVRSMTAGRTELEGTIRSGDNSVPAPFTDEECVYVDWYVEEYNDADDEWHSAAEGSQSVPFYLDDGSGSVLVAADEGDPTVEISEGWTRIRVGGGESPPPEIERFIDAHDSQYDETSFTENPVGAVADRFKGKLGHSNEPRRYVQKILPVGSEVYVLGSAVQRENAQANGGQETLLKVTRDESADEFILSDYGEAGLESHYEKWSPLEMIGGIAISTVCLASLVGVI